MQITNISTNENYCFDLKYFWREGSNERIAISDITSINKLEGVAGSIFFKVILNNKQEYVFKADANSYLSFYENYLIEGQMSSTNNRANIVQKTPQNNQMSNDIPVKSVSKRTDEDEFKEKNKQEWKQALWIVGAAIVVFLIVKGESFSSKENFCSKEYAIVHAEDVVRNRLKSPTSAEFPSWSSFNVRNIGECVFIVSSYVDAQNGFGAQIRSNFMVKLKINQDGSGVLLDFELY